MRIQRCKDTRIQGYKDTGVQGYKDTRIQGYRGARIQGYKDTRIQGCKDTRIQGYKDTRIWVSVPRSLTSRPLCLIIGVLLVLYSCSLCNTGAPRSTSSPIWARCSFFLVVNHRTIP